jgi:hypothetical protein
MAVVIGSWIQATIRSMTFGNLTEAWWRGVKNGSLPKVSPDSLQLPGALATSGLPGVKGLRHPADASIRLGAKSPPTHLTTAEKPIDMRLLPAIFLVASGLLTGCASTGTYQGLRPATTTQPLIIAKRVEVTQRVGLADWEYSLSPGEYMPEQESEEGILYRGPGRSVVFKHIHGYRIMPGGLWVPKDSSKKPHTYIYPTQLYKDFKDKLQAYAAQPAPIGPEEFPEDAAQPVIDISTGNAGSRAATRVATFDRPKSTLAQRLGQPIRFVEVDNPELIRLVKEGRSKQ